MKIAGIVCEYNPFHNGHKYQIDVTRQRADGVVCVMSGNFVQRGEAAAFDKHTRAAMAISGGADLVVELPTVYAAASAEYFARNAVVILDALGVADILSFGAETDVSADLTEVARLLVDEPPEYKDALNARLQKGASFPAARSAAVDAILGGKLASILNSPNNILAVEYIKALIRSGSAIEPFVVKRMGAEHDSEVAADGFASASQIRKMIASGDVRANTFTPFSVSTIPAHGMQHMEKAIIANLRKMPIEELKSIADVNEGLENRIKRAAVECSTLDMLVENIKSKRYAHSRIRRIVLNSFLGITREMQEGAPPYIKILAFNETGQRIINTAKKSAALPIVKNMSQVKKLGNSAAVEFWEREVMFDGLWELFKE